MASKPTKSPTLLQIQRGQQAVNWLDSQTPRDAKEAVENAQIVQDAMDALERPLELANRVGKNVARKYAERDKQQQPVRDDRGGYVIDDERREAYDEERREAMGKTVDIPAVDVPAELLIRFGASNSVFRTVTPVFNLTNAPQ